MLHLVFWAGPKGLLCGGWCVVRSLGRKGWVWVAMLLCVGAGACAPTGPTDAVQWASKNRDQRLTWMGTEVFPTMAKLFQEFDPDRYKGKFRCETCHGENYSRVDYKMPHALFPMDPKNPISEKDSNPELAKYAKFMKETVLPEMKRLMGKDNITCNYCHETKLQKRLAGKDKGVFAPIQATEPLG